jgi:Synergist-CTERM protein sorting domain-containing protein
VAEDGSTEYMAEGRKYENGSAYFKTNHLSVYAVTYNAGYGKNVLGGSGGGCDAGTAGFVLLAAAAVAMMANRKRW